MKVPDTGFVIEILGLSVGSTAMNSVKYKFF